MLQTVGIDGDEGGDLGVSFIQFCILYTFIYWFILALTGSTLTASCPLGIAAQVSQLCILVLSLVWYTENSSLSGLLAFG